MSSHVSLRRTRLHPVLRHSLEEYSWHPKDLIAPVFVKESLSAPTPLSGLQGHEVHSVNSIVPYVEKLVHAGIHQILLFGVPHTKHADARATTDPQGIVPQTLQTLKKKFKSDLFIWTDVCLCSATNTGQCGFQKKLPHTEALIVDNQSTVHHLAQTALTYARSGADGIAPSDMMDGRILAIRQLLNENVLSEIPIMSYAAKFASQMYGPFREAAQSTPQKNSTSSPRADYQINPSQKNEALRAALRDRDEGADIIMVKPGMPYLDILNTLSQQGIGPLAVYHVSGEYAALQLLSKEGYGDRFQLFNEAMISFKRAGAQLIITYAAEFLAQEFYSRSTP